jgi:WD40 repeat protein
VAPSGRRIYVIGTSTTSPGDQDVAVIAYRGNGSRIWTRRIKGSDGSDTVAGAALGPNGRSIYLTGSSAGDLATAAFRRDGTRRWADAFDGPTGGVDAASDLTLSPDGQTLFVTGTSDGTQDDDVVTIAYASSGTRLWTVRNEDSGNATADCIDASPDGEQVFVTADVALGAIATFAYSYNGDPLWSTTYSEVNTSVRDCAVSPDGSSLIAAGYDDDVYEHLVTIAYSTR